MDLALNNLQGLIYHKTKQTKLNQTITKKICFIHTFFRTSDILKDKVSIGFIFKCFI